MSVWATIVMHAVEWALEAGVHAAFAGGEKERNKQREAEARLRQSEGWKEDWRQAREQFAQDWQRVEQVLFWFRRKAPDRLESVEWMQKFKSQGIANATLDRSKSLGFGTAQKGWGWRS